MYTPSKKIIYILVSCIISVSLIYFAQKSYQKSEQLISPEVVENNTIKNEDTYGSELEKEIQNSTEKNGSTSTPKDTTSQKPQTLTENFTQDFFSKYLQAQSGGSVDPQTKDALIASMLDKYSNPITIENHFDIKNITTSSSLDQDKTRQYGNSFITIEDEGVSNANKTSQNSDDPKNLAATGAQYKKLANDLSKIVTPEAIREQQLAIINNYYRLGEVLEQMSTTTSGDPVKFLFLMKEVEKSQTDKDLIYQDITTFIKNSGIIFTDNEPGSYWTK